jgi:hypothetical protein
VFNVQSTPLTTGHTINLTTAEYFWDTDPGLGNGTPLLAFDGNFDQALETAFSNTPPASLPSNGSHRFSVRVLGQDGAWSPVFAQVVNVAATPLVTGHLINLTAAEYFWDTDPGPGNGTPLLAFDGNFDQALETAFSNTPPAILPNNGLHRFAIRVLGQDGAWSPVFAQVVNVAATPLATGHLINLTRAEIFWDTDPGPGNGTPLLAFDGNFDEALEIVGDSLATFSLSLGPHALYTRVQGQDGSWSPVFGVVVQIDTSLFPVISAMLGDSVFCGNDSLNGIGYTVSSQPNATYTWTVVGGTLVSGGTTNSITVNWDANAPTHEVRLQACNSFGCGNTFVKPVAIGAVPNVVITTSTGLDSFCTADSLTLTAGAGMGNYVYVWNTTATDSNLIVTNTGNYQVTATDVNSGCFASTQRSVYKTVIDTAVTRVGATLSASTNNDSYQWLDCQTGLPILGANNASYTVTANGLYAVALTKNGCRDTSGCHSVFFTALPSFVEEPSILVYPNPNNGTFTIDFGAYAKPDASIELWNALGQRVYQSRRSADIQTIQQQQLPAGVYILRIEQQITHRLVIE